MQLDSGAPFLERTRSAIDRLRFPAAILPCSEKPFATFGHPVPTKASSRLIVLFRAKILGGRGQLPGQARSADAAPANDPLRDRIGCPAPGLSRTGHSHAPFA